MATPNYTELAQMAQSSAFKDRTAIATASCARYILNEDPGTEFHTTRAAWAKSAALNPRSTVAGILELISLDSVFTTQDPLNLATTPDTGAGSLQVAVEATINATFLKF